MLPERPSISLAMIVRDCAENLKRCINSVREHVDEIVIVDTGSIDNTRAVAESYTDKVYDFVWIDDFSAARNFSFEKVSHPLVMWLDDDDVVVNAESLTSMARVAFSLGFTECRVDYDYIHDRHGNCRHRQQRERFLNRDIYEWRERVHETPCGKYMVQLQKILREQGYIKHASLIEDEQENSSRTARNLRIFQDMEKKKQLNHRLAFLYANALQGIGKFDEALMWYRRYTMALERNEMHYAALTLAALCLMKGLRFAEAKAMLAEAIAMYPNYGSAYMRMTQVYALEHKWDEAITWAEEAILHQKGAEHELHYDPTDIAVVPHSALCGAYLEMARLEEAEKELSISLKYYPDNEALIDYQRRIDSAKGRVICSDAFRNLVTYAKAEGRDDKIEGLADSVPSVIRYLPDVLKHRSRPAKKDDRPSIGIFCPISFEPWGPKSLETGIGGSETAVIHMSQELEKLGWEVTVYAHTKEIGTHDGVHWTHFLGFNHDKDYHDVMVSWRDPRAPMMAGQNCKVSVYWGHDILQEAMWLYDPELLYDQVFVLSEYHKQLYQKRIPEDLLWVTANGTDPALWAEPANELGKIIYSSCPSRGLLLLLQEWTYVLDEVPNASLDIYYGWNAAFQALLKTHPDAKRLFLEVEQLKKQPGITWHSRVSKKELHEAQAKAQVWAYPCIFPEVSCITAMEAQIHGATPVVNNYAALDETVQYGLKGTYDFELRGDHIRYIETLVKELKNPGFDKKEEMIRWARERFRWENVALQWDQYLKQLLKRSGSEVRRIQPGATPKRVSLQTT